MRNLTFALIAYCILCVYGFAQTVVNEDEYIQRIEAAIAERGFEERILATEDAIKALEKKGDWELLAKTFYDDIWLKKELSDFVNSFNLQKGTNKRIQKLIVRKQAVNTAIIENWRQILLIHDLKIKKETPMLLEALNAIGKFNIGKHYDRSHPNFKLHSLGKTYLSRSISLAEKLYGPRDIRSLKTIADFGNHMFDDGEYEEAAKLYSRLISNSASVSVMQKDLVSSAFRNYATILTMTERNEESQLIFEKLSKITATTETPSLSPIDISKRSLITLFDAKVRMRSRSASTGAVFGNSNAVRNPAQAESYNKTPNRFGDVPSYPYYNVSSVDYSVGTGFYYSGRYKIIPVKIMVVIDEFGNILDAKGVEIEDQKIKESVEKTILKTKFRPFVLDGIPRKMNGFVIFQYASKRNIE